MSKQVASLYLCQVTPTTFKAPKPHWALLITKHIADGGALCHVVGGPEIDATPYEVQKDDVTNYDDEVKYPYKPVLKVGTIQENQTREALYLASSLPKKSHNNQSAAYVLKLVQSIVSRGYLPERCSSLVDIKMK